VQYSATAGNLQVGGSTAVSKFDGKIMGVAVYEYGLTAAEIEGIYEAESDLLTGSGMVASSYSLDAQSRGYLITRRKTWKPGTDRAVLLCNGFSRRAYHVLGGTYLDASTRRLAATVASAGLSVATSDLTTELFPATYLDSWGNADVIDQVAALKTWSQDTAEAAPGKVLLIGISMGATAALNYALSLDDPASQVGAIVLISPALDPGDIAGTPRDAILRASIYYAFGGTAETYAAQGPAYNPNLRREEIGAMGIPIHIWQSNDDPIAVYSIAQDFVANTANVEMTDVGAYGHVINEIPTDDIAAWLRLYR
jgi:predicted alpha/beta hydrolase family esterase